VSDGGRRPAAARGDTGWGVAWEEDGAVWFSHVAHDGARHQPPVRLSSEDGGAATWPSLVWTGRAFAVAWEEQRLGISQVWFTQGTFGCPYPAD